MTFLQPPTPIVVEVIAEPTRETTVYEVLIGAVGLLGVIVVAALIVGLVAGGFLIGVRKWRDRQGHNEGHTAVQLGIDPASRRD